jgi:hypothetical protein
MKKSNLNYAIDVLAFFAIILVGITGVLKFQNFSKILGIHPLPLWIHGIHDWAGIVLVFLMLLHIILHWKWLIAMTKNKLKRKK